ncbi:MAG: NAD-dependent epimerase/dehydratase family protein [Cyclobacteriaceae bacterium]|nr:NAD-dependent epimerase/dehydratase family protein [Cyclobacteriaceae bacterium]
MMNVLITGVSGYLGTHLVRHLQQYPVRLFGHSHSKQQVEGVMLLPDLLPATLDAHAIEVVVHLAGIAHDLRGVYRDEDYHRVNTQQTISLWSAFQASQARTFIFLSSIKALSDGSPQPLTEESHPAPASPYGLSKLNAERALTAAPAPGKKLFIFRPCMIYGGSNKGNLRNLIRFVEWGLPFPLGKFQTNRSFLSVENACWVIAQAISDTFPPGTYNIADDEPISVNDLVRLIAKVKHRPARVWSVPASWVATLATIAGKRDAFRKLTTDMVTDTSKLRNALPAPLPVSIRAGLTSAIQSGKD